jgi:hypothetical protein
MQGSSDLVDKEYVAHWATQLGLWEIWEAILRRVDSA